MATKKTKKINRLHKFLSKDRNVLIVAVLVSLLLWVVVSYNELNEVYVSTRVNDIPITINSSSFVESDNKMKYSIVSLVKTASVDINGRKALVNSITKDDILVMADVSDITTPGAYEIKLTAVDLRGMDYIISNVSPQTVSIFVAKQ